MRTIRQLGARYAARLYPLDDCKAVQRGTFAHYEGYDHQSPTKGNTGKPCRLFERGECKLHFSATTGTLFHDSHLPLQKWFMMMALMGEANKVSVRIRSPDISASSTRPLKIAGEGYQIRDYVIAFVFQ
jgi:hypothetical protein